MATRSSSTQLFRPSSPVEIGALSTSDRSCKTGGERYAVNGGKP